MTAALAEALHLLALDTLFTDKSLWGLEVKLS